jgi:Tn3 transposase DDE domain
MFSRDQLKRAASLTEEDFVQLGRCLLFYGRRGRINARELWEQMNTCSCLNLILACIVYWQAREDLPGPQPVRPGCQRN